MGLGAPQVDGNKKTSMTGCKGVSTDAGAPGGDQLSRKTQGRHKAKDKVWNRDTKKSRKG